MIDCLSVHLSVCLSVQLADDDSDKLTNCFLYSFSCCLLWSNVCFCWFFVSLFLGKKKYWGFSHIHRASTFVSMFKIEWVCVCLYLNLYLSICKTKSLSQSVSCMKKALHLLFLFLIFIYFSIFFLLLLFFLLAMNTTRICMNQGW